MCPRGSRSTAGQPQRDLTDFFMAPVRESSLCQYLFCLCVYCMAIFKVSLLLFLKNSFLTGYDPTSVHL